jgi:RNA polymerase sigma factor (sigma-70 family)
MGELADTESELRALMLAALDGDAAAYRRLLGAVDVLLRRYYARRLNGGLAGNGEDLVQETLMAIHARRLTYDREQRFTAWIYAIARYKLIDHFRRNRVRATVPIEDEDAFAGPDTEAEISARLDVAGLLDTLPPKPRELIRQTRIEGHSVADAAARAGMTETAAKVSIHRGLKALMARMTGGHPDER